MATGNENTRTPVASVADDDRSIRGDDQPVLDDRDRPTLESEDRSVLAEDQSANDENRSSHVHDRCMMEVEYQSIRAHDRSMVGDENRSMRGKENRPMRGKENRPMLVTGDDRSFSHGDRPPVILGNTSLKIKN